MDADLEEVLRSVGVSDDAIGQFVEEGFTALEDVKEVALEEKMQFPYKNLGLKMMQWRKLLKKFKESEEPAAAEEEVPPAAASPVQTQAAATPEIAAAPVVKGVREQQEERLKGFYKIYNPSKADDTENIRKILDEYQGDYQNMWKHLEQKYILGKETSSRQKKVLDKKPVSKADAILAGIADLYRNNIRELEAKYKFPDFHSPLMDDVDFKAKPIVLLVGQYSVGKTSFIKYLLERDFPGSRIGPEPTTDSFMAVMHGDTEKNVPGNAAVMDRDLPFRTLQRFGIQFLNKFSVSTMPAPILESISFLDTPGILSGEKQRLGRQYDFAKVVEQFAHRSDRILLLFDAHKLDISDEFRGALEMLKGHDDKVRCILNKCDQVPNQQLLRVYGALMWSLGKVFKTPEVLRVYVGSFWDNPYEDTHNADLFDAEAEDLIADLKSLPRHRVTRKINEFVKRTRQFKVHCLILKTLKGQFGMFGKSGTQKKILATMPQQFKQIADQHGLTLADFPNPNKFTQIISNHDIKAFPKIKPKYLEGIDQVLHKEVPRMMKMLPGENDAVSGTGGKSAFNPFANSELAEASLDPTKRWVVNAAEKKSSDNEFFTMSLQKGQASGTQCRQMMMQSGLSNEVLASIWGLADITQTGSLDADEYALCKWLINYVKSGNQIPQALTINMVPPSHRKHFQRTH
jgi:GTPase SAR1 family protein